MALSPPSSPDPRTFGALDSFVIVQRLLLPGVVTRTMPFALIVSLLLSQVAAIVNLPQLLLAIHSLHPLYQASIGLGVWFGGLLLGPSVVDPVLQRSDRFTSSLPIPPTLWALFLLPSWCVAVAPATLFAGLLGPRMLLPITIAAALSGALWRAQARSFAIGTGVLIVSTGWIGLFIVGLSGPKLARLIRAGRPLGRAKDHSLWWAQSPLSALIWRGALGLLRGQGARLFAFITIISAASGAIQSTLSRSWSQSAVDTGAVILAGSVGWIPAYVLAKQAEILSHHDFQRNLPVSRWTRTAALVLTGALSISLPAAAQTCANTCSPVGITRVWLGVLTFASVAAWLSATARDRSAILGTAVPIVLALSIGSAALGPLFMGVQAVLLNLSIWQTTRRFR